MGIQINNPESYPAVSYDHVHMLSMSIDQPYYTDDNAISKYTMRITFKMYGIVNGVRYYENHDLRTINIDDFITEATIAAGNGNMNLVNSLGAIELAIANIIDSKTDLTGATIV